MKRLIAPGIFCLWLSICAFTQNSDQVKSVVQFKEVSFNFGTVPFGSDVSHTFTFKNISKDLINIREVQTSCGCTTPKYSNAPIKPHRKGSVVVKYDSKRVGHFHKTLEVLLSDQELIELTIEGDIQPEKPATPGK
jgi:hypothetical protein